MEPNLIQNVLKHAQRGDDVLMRRRNADSGRIKVKYGFMKLRTKRFSVDGDTYDQVRSVLKNGSDHEGSVAR